MAYLDLSETRLSPAFALATTQATFNGREWMVIALARGDTAASLEEPGKFRRTLEAFFKIRRANRLADPRLEALRRMAVLLRIGGGNTSADERAGFFSAGFSRAHLGALAGLVAKAIRS
jgi:hypothetical protein